MTSHIDSIDLLSYRLFDSCNKFLQMKFEPEDSSNIAANYTSSKGNFGGEMGD